MAKRTTKIDGADNTASNTDSGTSETEPTTGAEANGVANETGENTETIGGTAPNKPEEFATEQPKKKRGRPAGSGKKDKTETVDLSSTKRKPSAKGISTLAGVYHFANNTLAMRSNAKEFVIQPQEAQLIAEPLAEVAAEWGIHFDGAENPYLKLGMALMMVYSMRVMAYRARKKEEMKPPENTDENVLNMSEFMKPKQPQAPNTGKVDFSNDKDIGQ